MKTSADRIVAWVTIYAFLVVQFPLAAQGRGEAAPSLPSGAAAVIKPVVVSRTVSPGEAAVLELDGVRLEVPAGAVSRPTRLSVTRLALVAPLDEGMSNVTSGGTFGYRFQPHGIRFQKPVSITIGFDPSIANSETALSNLYTYFYDDGMGRWERLQRDRVDRKAMTVTSLSSHFTDMINATLKLPEGPQPIQYDVNSIKKLEAANPGEGVPQPEGPQPGPFGAASFSLPLRLPPGRGGATPQLALRYSSEGPESWLGRGFDIEVPSITIDTRFGLPHYDGTDRYTLEGEELLPIGADSDGALLFEPRAEKRFQRIRWYRSGGAGGADDFWQVTDKDGTVSEFGHTAAQAWLGLDRVNRGQTFTWFLSRKIDSFGNTVSYTYVNDGANNYTYLSDISYSGSTTTGEAGPFDVQFALESTDRQDRRVDSRGKFTSKLARRLQQVNLSYRGDLVRSYQFTYVTNEFGQSELATFAETDGAGSPFYQYSFDYYALPVHTDSSGSPGYDAFGAEEQWPLQSAASQFPGLTSNTTSSISGDLYLGVEVSIDIPFIGKDVIANFGIRGGVQSSASADASTLLDVNGDGLPDLVWRNGGSLYAYLNTGSGFDVTKPFMLPGLSSAMGAESSSSYSFGLSAGLLGAEGAITWQESWADGGTAFMDVNGDGLPDFVNVGSGTFGLNDGTGLVPTSWSTIPAVAGGATAELGDDSYSRAYYLQEPFRAWKAYRSGTVVVDQQADLLSPGPNSDVSLYVDPPISAQAQPPLHLMPGAVSLSATSQQYSMNAQDLLYFHVDAGSPTSSLQEAARRTKWNVKIRYTSIKLFENLNDGAIFEPPASPTDSDLQPIYHQVYNPTTKTFDWVLTQGWESMDPGVLSSVYTALITDSYFVPRRVPKAIFEQILAAASLDPDYQLSYTTTVGGKTYTASAVSRTKVILEGFRYEPETETFVRTGSPSIQVPEGFSTTSVSSDELFMQYLAQFSFAQKKSMAFAATVDGTSYTPVQTFSDGSVGYAVAAAPQSFAAAVTDPAQPGNIVPGKGILVDIANDVSGAPAERLWLVQDASGQWALNRESLSAATLGQVHTETGVAAVSTASGTMSISLVDHGVLRGFAFSGQMVPLQLADSVYSGPLSTYLLSGKVFSTDSYQTIPAASWAAMTNNNDSTNAVYQALTPCYAAGPNGDYHLLDPSNFTSDQLHAALFALNQASPQGPGLLTTLTGDLSGTLRLILLSQTQMDALAGATSEALSGEFTSFIGSDSATYYYQSTGLGSSDLDKVLTAMQRYDRDTLLFPYYTYDGATAVWNAKTIVTTDQSTANAVLAALNACGIQAWTSLSKSIQYTTLESLPVAATVALPGTATEDQIVPTGSSTPRAGEMVGELIVAGFDAAGATVYTPHYLHDFDSLNDFSAQDLVVFPKDSQGNPLYRGTAQMSGGVYAWYYAVWSGYYPWSKGNIGLDPSGGGSSAMPPYSATMSSNLNSDGTVVIATSGRDYPEAVGADAWIGNVSHYTDVSMNADLSTATTPFAFAAFIDADELSLSRNGGDAYYRIPRGGGNAAGTTLPFLRNSHSSATDINGDISVGGLGGTFSQNLSSSWQYRGFMDINGDRYPDLISFPDSSSDATSFTVVQGNGQGFGATATYSLPGGGHMARYDTTSYGFGGSTSASSGGMFTFTGSKGETKSITLEKPDTNQSTFMSGSVAVNGTFGSTVQSEGFYDINGDGLPDYVTRGGGGHFFVALNRGDGTFATPVDWGSSINVTAFPGLGSAANTTQGLTFTGTGSFGSTGGYSVGIGGVEAGVSAGFSATVNQTYSMLVDVNGDGLPDQVVKLKSESFFRVRYNLGDHFSEEVHLYRPEWGISSADFTQAVQQDLGTLSQGLDSVSLPGGYGPPGMKSLPNPANNPLGSQADPFSLQDDLEYSTGASFNLGANFSFGFSLWLIAFTISPGLNGSVASTQASVKFVDIDGDGLPDHVMKLPNENFLRVKRNLSGTVGLLKDVKSPQGGTYSFTYARVGNTVDMPMSKWVMASLTRDDGVTSMTSPPTDRGVHAYTETYAYSNGSYDRSERMFYGFAQVAATRASGAVTTTTYLNHDYYTRGLSAGGDLRGPDAQGNPVLYQQSLVNVQKTPIRTVARADGQRVDIFFPNVTSETTRQYQAGSSSYVETSRTYSYDAFGNVVDFFDNGTTGATAEMVHAHIVYDLNIPGADYQKQSPSSIRVEDSNGGLMRLRQGSYGSHGELLQLDQYESASVFHSWTLTYDAYGNLASIADPRGHTLAWAYDPDVHSYAVLIRTFNSTLGGPEYDSNMTWNVALGQKMSETDPNGQPMSYAYDTFGRLVEVRSPYDTGSVPAVSYQYNTSAFPWTAVTNNKLLYDPTDTQTMQTVIAMDGLGRALQTAKQGEQRDSSNSRITGWNLSGAIAYDANGRTVQEGQPQFAAGPGLPALAAMKNATSKSYDAQDRVLQQVLPDTSTISISYAVSAGGLTQAQRTTDPLGNMEERQTDGRGNITAVSRMDKSGAVLMSATYRYDGLSQILSATDSQNNAVQVAYDLMGRKTSLQSPDTGIQTMSYDASGNLAEKITSVLRSKGEAIDYQYDGLNRLTATVYPESPSVHYTYGAPGAANNAAGRLVQRDDESGTVRYQYGLLGETTEMTRSITRLSPLEAPVSATISYVSDYLGRLQQITYPDGEVLTYGYDSGGQVRTVTGQHYSQTTNYVNDIGYDEFGQRTYIEYGNGVRTNYSYDPQRRWLKDINTQSQYGNVLQAMNYSFDPVGNILGYSNNTDTYSTSQTYSYDSLYQLTGATGTSSSHPSGIIDWTSTYQQSFGFDGIGNMTQKTSSVNTNPSRNVGDGLNYSLNYSYYTGKAHQAEIIGDLYYRYDANGNTIEERQGGHGTGIVLGGTVSKSGTLRMTDRGFGLVLTEPGTPAPTVYSREFVWDEENRLQRTVDSNLTVDYRYGADGQRAVKYSSRGESLYFDSLWTAQTDAPSLRQSKQVYVGSTRIATQLNIAGNLDVGYEQVNTYYYHPDHLGSSQLVTDYQGKQYEHVEYTPYGESWIDQETDSRALLPYKFTSKELDSETGLYYYGARYLNPKTSRWISADPAMEDYLPVAPVSDDARKHNENLPGTGGVFNLVNLAVYHYSGNNPVRYVDPDGSFAVFATLFGAASGFIGGAVKELRMGTVGQAISQLRSGNATAAKALGLRMLAMTAIGAAQGAVVGTATEAVAAAVAETILSGGGGAAAGVLAVVATAAATGAVMGALGDAAEQYVYGGSIDWTEAANEGLIAGGLSALGGISTAVGKAAKLGVDNAMKRIPLVPRTMKAGLAMQAADYQGVANGATISGLAVDAGSTARDAAKKPADQNP